MDTSVDANRESDCGQRTGFWRRYGLVAYWLLFAVFTVYAILGVSNGVTLVTDLPAYSDVPSQFHMVTFVGLFIVALVMAARSPRTEPG
jgi:polyferredoxin